MNNEIYLNNGKKAANKKPPKKSVVKKIKRKRMIKSILAVLFALAVSGILVFFILKNLFVVKTVSVTGSEIFTESEILNFVNIPYEMSIFKVDSEQIEVNIVNEFTYVESAKVNKRMPDVIEIVIEDSKECFYAKSGDIYKVYSQGLKFLRDSAVALEQAVYLNFDVSNENLMNLAKQTINVFRENDMNDINAILISDDKIVTVVYNQRFEINLGTEINLDYKVKMCKKVIEEKIAPEEKGIIDASESGQVIFKRQ